MSGVRISGVGSMPGTDFGGAARLILDEVPDLPFVPELPARGPGAGLVGRGVGLLAGLAGELTSSGWRLADAAGVDQRRARAMLRDDLDRFAEAADGYVGPLKLAVPGPWTLSAALEAPRGGRVLADPGARHDLAASLAQGSADCLGELGRLVPGARTFLQVDEPALPAVLGGGIPTVGGYFRLRAIDLPEVADGLAALVRVAPGPVLHCCAGRGVLAELPLTDFVRRVGFGALSLDAAALDAASLDELAECVEAGASLYLGILPAQTMDVVPRPDDLAKRALATLRPLELGPRLADALVLTPSCGLAGWTPGHARRVWPALREAAGLVGEGLSS